MRQKREFKRIFGTDKDLINVVQAIRTVKKNKIERLARDVEREKHCLQDAKMAHQIRGSSETLARTSQFMQSLKKPNASQVAQNQVLAQSIGPFAARSLQSKLSLCDSDIHKMLQGHRQASGLALRSKKTLGGYDMYDIKEGESIDSFSNSLEASVSSQSLESAGVSKVSRAKRPKEQAIIERQYDKKILGKLFSEIDKLGDNMQERTLLRKKEMDESQRRKSKAVFERWPTYRAQKRQMQDVAINLVKRKAFWREYMRWMQARKILDHLAAMMRVLRERKLRMFMLVYVAIKFKVRFEIAYCRHWGQDFRERNRRYIRKHLKWWGGIPAV